MFTFDEPGCVLVAYVLYLVTAAPQPDRLTVRCQSAAFCAAHPASPPGEGMPHPELPEASWSRPAKRRTCRNATSSAGPQRTRSCPRRGTDPAAGRARIPGATRRDEGEAPQPARICAVPG